MANIEILQIRSELNQLGIETKFTKSIGQGNDTPFISSKIIIDKFGKIDIPLWSCCFRDASYQGIGTEAFEVSYGTDNDFSEFKTISETINFIQTIK
jgi:hypothetical protein